MIRRGLRHKLVAGLGIALAMPVLPVAAESARSVATQTTLNVETSSQGQFTEAHAIVTVTGDHGLPAQGTVAIEEGSRQLASMALNGAGQAVTTIGLPAGSHTLRAVYSGDATHLSSVSQATDAQAQATSTPDFQVTVSSLSPSSTLAAGSAGTATVTLTPINNAALNAPMFITLSCSGLPDQSACTFTPASLEIETTTPTSCPSGASASACPPTSSMVIQTQGPGTAVRLVPPPPLGRQPSLIAWAFLLPGALGLGGLAWSARRRRWLNRVLLLAIVGVVTMLGTTGCNPHYYYYNHGQPTNPPTPAGSYTVVVTAQSSNGITAITHSTTLALTVQ